MQVDPRGQRVAAAITTAVLVAVLVTGSWIPLAAQAVVFVIGAVCGPRYAPYGVVFTVLVRPRLGPPRELEDAAPFRFAQAVGFGLALTGVVGYVLGAGWLGIGATSLALGAAFLNAAFGLCLGCEIYLLIRRLFPHIRSDREVPA